MNKPIAKTIISGAHLVLEHEVVWSTNLVLENGIITGIGSQTEAEDHVIEAKGKFVFPGFIDLHVHGAKGFHMGDIESELALDTILSFHASHGTTSILPTTTTTPHDKLKEVLAFVSRYKQKSEMGSGSGSTILGIHLEGPFISEQFAGAQKKDAIQPISMDRLQQYVEAAQGQIKLVTLAPEKLGAKEAIQYLRDRQIVVSAGHSGATYEEMEQAIEWGVRHVTHFYNGMRGFLHREPGMLAAALLDDRVVTEYICDGVHSHFAAGRLLLKNKGSANIALITDAVREAGQHEGVVRNKEGSLAGSTLTMGRGVKNAITHLKATLPEAARMSSLTPARVIGYDRRKGSIAVGKDADLVIMDDQFQVAATIIGGRTVYERE